MTPNRASVRRSETGLSLLEVVIALALLAMVLLGISSVFVKAGKSVKSGRELTEATSIATDILEEFDRMSYSQTYTLFGGTTSGTSLSVDTRTNTFALKWQPLITQRLNKGYGTITVTPLGGATSPPNFGSGKSVRVVVTMSWTEGLRARSAAYETTRF